MRCYGIVRELSPDQCQLDGLRSAVGACRFAQNAIIHDVKDRLSKQEQQSWSSFSLHTRWREIRSEVAPWYGDVSKEAFQYGAERASLALKNWSSSKKGKRSGPKIGFPSFRRRGCNDSVRFSDARIRPSGLFVLIPRVGDIHLMERFAIPDGARLTAVTVRPKAGRWFVTFHVREDDWIKPDKTNIESTIGIDLGVGDRFATMSDGSIIENPRFFRSDAERLRRAQKSVSRKRKGSNNRLKAVQRVQRVHFDIANRRADFIHKFTSNVVKSHDEIVIEDLNVKGMSRGGFRLGKSVGDVAMAEVRRQITYKCEWYGKTLTVVSRWFPSSKMCSTCGNINGKLKLSDRVWLCPCGANHDRDLNAALNLAASSAVAACGDISSDDLGRETSVYEAGIMSVRS